MKTEEEIKEQIELLKEEYIKDKDNVNAITTYGLGINILEWVLED